MNKGDPLIRIDPTRFESAFKEGAQNALGLKARIARLNAEANRAAFRMPPEVVKGSPTIAERETALHRARQSELTNKVQVLRQQLVQRESELKELQSRAERLAEQLVLVEREVTITAPLVKRGVVSEVELLRLERDQSRTRTDLEQARLSMPRVAASIDEARAKLADAEVAFRSQAAAELAQVQAELAKVAEQIPALEDRAARTIVRAPMDGVVKTIPNRTIGGVVQPGSPMVEIVPREDSLLIETRLKPADIAFVQVGQRAIVKVTFVRLQHLRGSRREDRARFGRFDRASAGRAVLSRARAHRSQRDRVPGEEALDQSGNARVRRRDHRQALGAVLPHQAHQQGAAAGAHRALMATGSGRHVLPREGDFWRSSA